MTAPQILRKNYRQLRQYFGPQGWWPTTPKNKITPQYFPKRKVKGRSESEKVEICVGALLTQNTAWKNVEKALINLNKSHVLNLSKLKKISKFRLKKCIRSSGYFRQKTKRLKIFCDFVTREGSGRVGLVLKGNLGFIRDRLLGVPGIGPETADSMLLYAGGHPIFVVDAYTRRIAQRWGIIKGNETYLEIQNIFQNSLPQSADIYGEYHALLVALAKDYCRIKPHCKLCPLNKICQKIF